MLLHGILPPITTPFYPDGKVYFKKLEANIDRYNRTPVSGMVVLGSTGEAILLSDDERRDVLKCARAAAAPEKVLVAGTGIESLVETQRLTQYAAELGYDAALVRTPHYYKAQINRPENMLAFYRALADRSPLPIAIYNFPQATAYDIPAEVVIELAEHANIIAIKESAGNLEKVKLMIERTRHIKRSATVTETFQAVTRRMLSQSVFAGTASSSSSPAIQVIGGLKTRQKEVGFQVLVGAAHQLEASLGLGAVGAILAFADAAPTACYEIYATWKEGDRALTREKQQRIVEAVKGVLATYSIPGLKYAMDLNGYYGGPVRLPLLPLNGEEKAEVERLMQEIKN